MNDNEIFEQASAFYRALRLIQSNANCDYVAEACGLDGRFVLALMLLEAEATV